jgi:hypothetical protein
MGFPVCVGAAEAYVGEHAVVEGEQGAAFAADGKGLGDAADDAGLDAGAAGEGGGCGGGCGAHDHLVRGWLFWLCFPACRHFDGQTVLMNCLSHTLLHNEIECF